MSKGLIMRKLLLTIPIFLFLRIFLELILSWSFWLLSNFGIMVLYPFIYYIILVLLLWVTTFNSCKIIKDFNLEKKKKIILMFVFAFFRILMFFYGLSILYYFLFLFFPSMWHLVMGVWIISLVLTILSVVFKRKKIKKLKNKWYIFIIVLLQLFSGLWLFSWLESLKSPWTTWWNSTMYFWWMAVIFFISLLDFSVILGKNIFNYVINWFSRLFIGIITIYWVCSYWFPDWDRVSDGEVLARRSVIVIWVIFIIEWVLFSVSYFLAPSSKE